jgi:hypothetical protein
MELEQSVVKKIQMSKMLYDLGNECFKSQYNIEKIGTGVVLLQDSVEIFLLAVCEQLNISLDERVPFPRLLSKIEEKVNEEIPLKRQMLNLNTQRVNIKHLGFSPPNYDDCKEFVNEVKSFFLELSHRYLKTDYESISFLELLKNDKVKELLEQAENFYKNKKFKECQINCRKALYLEFEKDYDIRGFERESELSESNDLQNSLLRLLSTFTKAPSYARNMQYIEKNVKEPVDYIVIDRISFEIDLKNYGINSLDLQNIRNVTPNMYYFEDEDEWVIKDEYKDENYNEENAEYCLRKTIEILLLKQRYFEKAMYSPLSKKLKSMIIKNRKANIYKKASTYSSVMYRLKEDCQYKIDILGETRGLKEKIIFLHIFGNEVELVKNEDENETPVTVDNPPDFFIGYLPKEEIKNFQN